MLDNAWQQELYRKLLRGGLLKDKLMGPLIKLNDSKLGDEGAYNFGVFDQGTGIVIKLTDLDFFQHGVIDISCPPTLLFQPETCTFPQSVVIHYMLGLLGMAPRLYGILHGAELDDFLLHLGDNGYTLQPYERERCIGVVMKRVPFCNNFIKRNQTTPLLQDVTQAGIDRLTNRIAELETRLNALGIFADDTQYFMDDQFNIQLGDLDGYFFSAKRTNQFSADQDRLRQLWRQARQV